MSFTAISKGHMITAGQKGRRLEKTSGLIEA